MVNSKKDCQSALSKRQELASSSLVLLAIVGGFVLFGVASHELTSKPVPKVKFLSFADFSLVPGKSATDYIAKIKNTPECEKDTNCQKAYSWLYYGVGIFHYLTSSPT